MRTDSGFTVVEIILVIVVITILLTMGSVQLSNSLPKARNTERKTDTQNIVNYLDSIYLSGLPSVPGLKGSYPSTAHLDNTAKIEQVFGDIDKKNLKAPNITASAYSITNATNNNQLATGVLPAPTITTYVYQPIAGDGTLCTIITTQCRKFNLFYKLEDDTTVYKLTSKNQ